MNEYVQQTVRLLGNYISIDIYRELSNADKMPMILIINIYFNARARSLNTFPSFFPRRRTMKECIVARATEAHPLLLRIDFSGLPTQIDIAQPFGFCR